MTTQASPKITPPGTDPEPELLTRARAGDREAFASLYNDNRAEVYRYLLGRVRNRELAEDLVQETFLRALRRIDTFVWQGTPIAGWLVTIARNLIVDYLKSARFRCEIAVGDALSMGTLPSLASEVSAEEAGLRVLSVAEAGRTVESALLCLTDAQAEVVRLRYLDGLSVQEAADRADRTPMAVKMLAYRAIATMRRQMVVAA
ncbi:sigma-70 family RNA polymerase sigma factor [Streptomyces sp. BE230]|uniref:sigma-70 family RNA polymerase sigma factor n=1 Tax=Streptomyces sp. BE230 TaxID=3002526 RepID=UPI002ED270CA|nr:sigma-70 family RNA polymerase sigma factor [Streptomyces sp. BE230]